ncbi:TetR/AcrR family transcriptional regulator [Isoptericola aurantiacus]|uniref:TetR/AcrR family transcriptional regulator n=1 Tax=Isoptericola aurantiacus TaxID=3377839 RepID=UPI00383BB90F
MPRDSRATRQRLQEAALSLFSRDGYDATTATAIAQAAGVTERTFFRHFADKRDVLFTPQDEFERPFLEAAAGAPDPNVRALIEASVLAGAQSFRDRPRTWSRARQGILDAEDRLAERERSKLASLAGSLEDAFAERGADKVTARLGAEIATSTFRIAFHRWINSDDGANLVQVQQDVLRRLDDVLGTIEQRRAVR